MRLDELIRPFDLLGTAEQLGRVEACRKAREGMMIGSLVKAAAKQEKSDASSARKVERAGKRSEKAG